MSEAVPHMPDYHAARALEELERADRSANDIARRAHLELSRLHLDSAGGLRGSSPVTQSHAGLAG